MTSSVNKISFFCYYVALFFFLFFLLVLPCFSILEQPIDDLFKAIEKGDVETVKKLISKGVSLNVHGGSLNVTPLHYAASTNNIKLAELLVTNKADIDARDEDNQTPLHTAAYNNSSEIAEVLLKKKQIAK